MRREGGREGRRQGREASKQQLGDHTRLAGDWASIHSSIHPSTHIRTHPTDSPSPLTHSLISRINVEVRIIVIMYVCMYACMVYADMYVSWDVCKKAGSQPGRKADAPSRPSIVSDWTARISIHQAAGQTRRGCLNERKKNDSKPSQARERDEQDRKKPPFNQSSQPVGPSIRKHQHVRLSQTGE